MMNVTTTDDGNDNSLPSFSSFSTELDPSWDYYERDTRSNTSTTDVITSQSNNYTRPWEMDTKDKGFEPFSKLPSFQSQFHSYSETNMVVPEPSLPQVVTPVPVPVSPSLTSPGHNGSSLTQLTSINPLQTGLSTLANPSFHTLTAVNPRTYPLVPAAIQARDIPQINQQYLEERHIQLYQPITTTQFPPQNMVTVIKNEPVSFDLKNGIHHVNFQNSLIDNANGGVGVGVGGGGLGGGGSVGGGIGGIGGNGNIIGSSIGIGGAFDIKIEKSVSPIVRCDIRKKERRKIRASSLESNTESDSSAMDIVSSGSGVGGIIGSINDGNSGQVAAISSTASFKSPMGSMSMGDDHDGNSEKQVSFNLLFYIFVCYIYNCMCVCVY